MSHRSPRRYVGITIAHRRHVIGVSIERGEVRCAAFPEPFCSASHIPLLLCHEKSQATMSVNSWIKSVSTRSNTANMMRKLAMKMRSTHCSIWQITLEIDVSN